MRSLSLVMSECSLSGREQFLHCGLRKFRHSKSSVDRLYTQLDRRRFVYDTYKTMEATRTRHGWVQMFTTHRLTLTLQLHNFDLLRTCRTALLDGNWQDFNWHDASRGPSAIAELLVKSVVHETGVQLQFIFLELYSLPHHSIIIKSRMNNFEQSRAKQKYILKTDVSDWAHNS